MKVGDMIREIFFALIATVGFGVLSPAGAAERVSPLLESGAMLVGCNYWGSKAGVHMWRTQDWDPQSIDDDLAALETLGVEIIRVFPTWSEFQPLVQNKMCFGQPGEYLIEGSETPVYDPLWIEPEVLKRFRYLCDSAQRHRIKLMVSLVTGWMSGRLFTPRMVEGKNLITDPEALMWEGRFARGFVRKMKDHPAIVAWDLGNECNCMGRIESSAQAWNWLNTISSAIRMEDPVRPVVSGMHSQTSNGQGVQWNTRNSWSLQLQGELLDVLTPHPYPSYYLVEANRGPFNGFRNALHPVSQCLYYTGVSGKPAFPQEVGSLGPRMYPEDMAALGMRQQLWTSWQHGLCGYLWWCAFDQMHLGYAPFSNNAMERELGMMKADAMRSLKPQAEVLRDFQKVRQTFPEKSLPPRRTDAVCLISEREEFYHQSAGAVMLAKQAGFDLRLVAAESQDLPDSDFYILPSGTGFETYSQLCWERLVKRVEAGATLLLSRGGAAGYSDWERVTGTKIVLYRQARQIRVLFEGASLALEDSHTGLLSPCGGEVVASDSTGNAVVVRHALGKGKVILVNLELERLAFASAENVFEGDFTNELWRFYAYAAREAGVKRLVSRSDCRLIVTEHPTEVGSTYVVVVNTHDTKTSFPLKVAGRVVRVWNGRMAEGRLEVRPNDGCILEVVRTEMFSQKENNNE